MCWNANVSLNTFAFALCACVLAGISKTLPLLSILLVLAYSSIQLVEYFLWKYLNHKTLNFMFSCIGLIIILIQPLFSILTLHNAGLIHYMNILLGLYWIYVLAMLVYYVTYKRNIKFNTTVASNGHLQWNWIPRCLVCALIWAFFFIHSSKRILQHPLSLKCTGSL
jgi:hypothetical protein